MDKPIITRLTNLSAARCARIDHDLIKEVRRIKALGHEDAFTVTSDGRSQTFSSRGYPIRVRRASRAQCRGDSTLFQRVVAAISRDPSRIATGHKA